MRQCRGMGARKGACGPLWHVHQQIFATFPAEKSPDLSWKLHTKVCKVLHQTTTTSLMHPLSLMDPWPPASSRTRSCKSFLTTNEKHFGTYYHVPGHPCNSKNVIADLWSEFRTTQVFVRESVLGEWTSCSPNHILGA